MVEPAHVDGAALVALAAQTRRRVGVGGDDHAALPGGHLLVGVEGEGGEVAAGPDHPALRVDRAERLAGVLEDPEAVALRQRLQLGPGGGPAEDVDRQEAPGLLGDGGRRGVGVDVERLGIDVDEDRFRPLVEERVRRGDEGERAGDDLVAGPPAELAHAEVERRRAARDRDRVLDAEVVGEGALEAFAPSVPRRGDRSGGPRARAPPRVRRFPARASGIEVHWNAYSSESTSACQDASITFPDTPVVPHSRSPSAESRSTRVTASVPRSWSRIRTL